MALLDWETIGLNARKHRIRLGLLQEDVALAAGLNDATVSRLEKGKAVNEKSLRSIMEALRVTIDDLSVPLSSNGDGTDSRLTDADREEVRRIADESARKAAREELERLTAEDRAALLADPNPSTGHGPIVLGTDSHGSRTLPLIPVPTRRVPIYGVAASADLERVLFAEEWEGPTTEMNLPHIEDAPSGWREVGIWVEGECLAPAVPDGAALIVWIPPDRPLMPHEWRPGSLVVARTESGLQCKRIWPTDNGRWKLAPHRRQAGVPVDERVVIVARVRKVVYDPEALGNGDDWEAE